MYKIVWIKFEINTCKTYTNWDPSLNRKTNIKRKSVTYPINSILSSKRKTIQVKSCKNKVNDQTNKKRVERRKNRGKKHKISFHLKIDWSLYNFPIWFVVIVSLTLPIHVNWNTMYRSFSLFEQIKRVDLCEPQHFSPSNWFYTYMFSSFNFYLINYLELENEIHELMLM